jgi:REP element-mobilizing transposase RayT
MRSSHATGSKSFLCSERALKIQSIIKKQESRFGVKVYEYANSGNHLHLVVRPRSRKAFQGFLRSITGLIARTTMNTERGLNKTLLSEVKKTKTTPQKTTKKIKERYTEINTEKNTDKKIEKFWDALPFTRILEWGKELQIITQYLEQNMLEAYGFSTKRKPLKLNFKYG